MTKTRIYTEQPLSIGASVELELKASAHLLRVLRMKTGDVCTLFNGDGHEYLGKIVNTTQQATVYIESVHTVHTESPLRIHLAQGISRGERMDYAIQKAVECGVDAITPLITARCGVKLTEQRAIKRQAHWQAVAISACEQSGRVQRVQVNAPITLPSLLTSLSGTVLLAHNEPGAPLQLTTINPSITVLIGPEGGLSAEERQLACQHQAQLLYLGPRTLRTETAAVVAITYLQTRLGDLS